MDCSLQAKYKYEDGLPTRSNAKTVFGSVVHVALQHLYDSGGDLEGARKRFGAMWANPDKYGYHIDWWPKYSSFDTLMKKGRDQIKAMHDSHRWQSFVVLGTEVPFLVPFGDHELTGFIDLLGIEKSGTGVETLKVIDYKTAAKIPTLAELALDPQLSTYLYAVKQHEFWTGVEGDPRFPGIDNGEWWWSMTRSMNTRAIWWSVMHNRQIDSGPRTEADFQRLYRVACEIDQATKAGIHVPRIGHACDWCDFVDHCRMEIPVALQQAGDKTDPNRWI